MKIKNKTLERFLMKTRTTSIDLIILSILILNLLFTFGFLLVGNWIFDGDHPEWYLGLGLFFAGLLLSLGGLAQIFKRESPWIPGRPITGKFAVVLGALWMAVSLWLSLDSLILMIQKLGK